MANRLAEQEKEKKAQIILLERFAPSFDALTDEQAGRMLKGIFQYKITRQEPDFRHDTILSFFWQDIKNWLDESETHYRHVCEVNKANINARWRGKNNDASIDTNEYERIRTNTNYTKANANANANATPKVKPYPKKGTVNLESSNKGNTDFDDMVVLYEEKIEVLKPNDKSKFQELINNNSLGDIKDAIDFMVSHKWKGIYALEKALNMNVDF